MTRQFKKGKRDGKFYSGEKSRRSPSPNKPTPRPTKKLERGYGGEQMTRQFKTTTDLDRWYRVETLNLITQLETRRITENNYVYRMVQLGKKWDRYHNELHGEVTE